MCLDAQLVTALWNLIFRCAPQFQFYTMPSFIKNSTEENVNK